MIKQAVIIVTMYSLKRKKIKQKIANKENKSVNLERKNSYENIQNT